MAELLPTRARAPPWRLRGGTEHRRRRSTPRDVRLGESRWLCGAAGCGARYDRRAHRSQPRRRAPHSGRAGRGPAPRPLRPSTPPDLAPCSLPPRRVGGLGGGVVLVDDPLANLAQAVLSRCSTEGALAGDGQAAEAALLLVSAWRRTASAALAEAATGAHG